MTRLLPAVQFNQNRLYDVFEFFGDFAGLSFVVDWEALREAGLYRDTPVSLTANGTSLGATIGLTLRAVGGGTEMVYASTAMNDRFGRYILFITTKTAQDRGPPVERQVLVPYPPPPNYYRRWVGRLAQVPQVIDPGFFRRAEWDVRLGSFNGSLLPRKDRFLVWVRPENEVADFGRIPTGGVLAADAVKVFDVAGFSIRHGGPSLCAWVVSATYRSACVATAILPLVWLALFLRRQRQRGLSTGQCDACGYDLRETPDRCPECGKRHRATTATPRPPGGR